ncbi:MAG TPA: PAS domain S-box protein, partial [Candidatus Didemnitutus sp.]|nr:PAS domain S-box protein [Candidatus Didemnitutus sp.]
TLVVTSRATGDLTQRDEAARRSVDTGRLFAPALSLLGEITALNYQIVEDAKQESIANYADIEFVRRVMLFSAAAGVLGAIGVALVLGRRLSRPVVDISDALTAVAKGDLGVQLPVSSQDEIGRAAGALNSMAAAMRNNQEMLRVLSDNLPSSMLYQSVLDHDGTMKFQYLSAGVERLHGVSAEDALRDWDLIFHQVLEEDRPVLVAAQQASRQSMGVFNVEVRVRRADGAVRWMHICSQPRPLPDGRTLWDGIETDVTESKRAEEALRDSEERFHAAILNSAIGMALVALDGTWMEVNNVLCRITGYAREVLLTTTFQAITHPDDLAADLEAARRLIAGEISTYSSEKRYIHKDGHVVWVQLNVSMARDNHGEPVNFITQVQDISERHRAEAALRESEARFRAIVSTSTIGMAILSTDFKTIAINPAQSRLLGYSEAETLERSPIESTFPEDRDATRERFLRLKSGEVDSYEVEKRFQHKAGHVVWAHVVVSRMRDTEGRTQYYLAQMADITERKLAELALAESAERLKIALDVSRLGVWRRNLVTGVTEWDERMFEISGRDPARGVPSYEEFIASVVPEDRVAVDTAWRNFVAGTGPFDVQFEMRRADGEVRQIAAQATLHRDEMGQPVWIVGVDADMTEFTRAREESGRLREQLRQAHRMETLGTLAAGVAHDFNNLLTGINGFIDLGAASLPPDHEAVELLKQARRGAGSARDLVKRILAFSRRIPDQERQIVSLATLIRDTAPLITAGLPAQVTLSLQVDQNVPPVRVDLGQIQQVLLNLCVNGAHAIGDRSGSIRIGLIGRVMQGAMEGHFTGRVQPGPYACLSVSDTGSGMSPEVCARIFEPFFTTKKAGEGTGLGLAMAQDIVTEHGGFIAVRSQLGRGTTFEIFLPTVVGEAALPVEVPTARVRGRGERVLVLDDEPSITQVAEQALRQAGFTTDAYNSSMEAWTKFAATPERYDLILADFQMPELTGVEFAVRVRHATATLPIIIMTARTGDIDLTKLQELGGVTVLPKPFDLHELIARVGGALSAKRREVAAAATLVH